MTIQIKHAFVSAKGDGGDATLVRPSNWNAAHTTSMATGNLLGRTSAGAGVFEEIPISPLVLAALSATTGADFLAALGVGGFSTGDLKFTSSATYEPGWLAWDGEKTIGNAASGAYYASATSQALFILLYTNIPDAYCPMPGGRSGNALTDFNNNKMLYLPRVSGRTVIGAGSGSGISTQPLGTYAGEQNHTLTVAELAQHYHVASIYDPAHLHSATTNTSSGGGVTGGGAFPLNVTTSATNTGAALTGVRVNSSNGIDTTYSTGSSNGHNNMQPYLALNFKIKL